MKELGGVGGNGGNQCKDAKRARRERSTRPRLKRDGEQVSSPQRDSEHKKEELGKS